MYPWTLNRNLLRQNWISWFEPCEIANLRPRADICNLTWLSFCRFFELKGFLFEFYFFRAFPVWVEYRFHDDKHNLSWWPGQFGCISGCRGVPRFSHTAPAARRDCIFTNLEEWLRVSLLRVSWPTVDWWSMSTVGYETLSDETLSLLLVIASTLPSVSAGKWALFMRRTSNLLQLLTSPICQNTTHQFISNTHLASCMSGSREFAAELKYSAAASTTSSTETS